MKLIIRLAISTLAVFAAAYILPGIVVDGWTTALIVAVILGLLNTILKPVLIFLTLPATIVTLGLFILVINAVIVLLAAWLVPGFDVLSFWWALGFSLVASAVSGFLNAITG
jgi:putative membrane protein